MGTPTHSHIPAILRSMHAAYAEERGVDQWMIPLTMEAYEVLAVDFSRCASLRRSRELIRILVDFGQSEIDHS
ncbi:hypothetical protein [uncultured Shimia sp.]|uniref:hypothetical protein n=1 Tax=uncultured Shimia sp. TaxID=573152 RepID=UPI0026313CE1|nr:hypothetical protein [uncultured Shimia sp.]